MRKLMVLLFVFLLLFALAAARQTIATGGIKYGTFEKQAQISTISTAALVSADDDRGTLTPLTDLATGFEAAEGFITSANCEQNGWTKFVASNTEGHIDTAHLATGSQHVRIAHDPTISNGTLTGCFSPDMGVQPAGPSTAQIAIAASDTGGADYDFVVQAPSQGFTTARIKFFYLGDILILDDNGSGGVAFFDSGVNWTVGPYRDIRIEVNAGANTIDYYYDGALIYQGSVYAGTAIEQVVLISDNFHITDVGDFDDLQVDNPGGPTDTPAPTNTFTPTPTATPSLTPTVTPTDTPTSVLSYMPFMVLPLPLTNTPTVTPTPSDTPTSTATPINTVTPTATPTPESGQIVFSSDRDGNVEIYVMNTDGSGQTRLTNNSARDSDPAWSPDRTKIVFRSDRDGNDEIYVMNADGSGETRLTNNLTDDKVPNWSPDGAQIVFESGRDGNDEIYVMNADGSAQINLTNNPEDDFDPVWSPDGTKIAFASIRNNDSQLYVMNADGSGQTPLTNSNLLLLTEPDWSPDGTRIVFTHFFFNAVGYLTTDIYVVNVDGSGLNKLTNTDFANELDPAWSPDSSQIVYGGSSTVSFGSEDIHIMNADGSGKTALTDNAENNIAPDW